MKTNKSYIIVAALVIISIILLSNKLIIWGIGVLAAALIILGIQQLIKLNVKVLLFKIILRILMKRIIHFRFRIKN